VGTDVTVFNDATVVPDSVYRYRVFAFNGDGNSPLSNEVTITIPATFGIYFSTVGVNAIPGVANPDDADLYTWDGTAFGRLFDASAAGLPAGANVDGLTIVNANQFYLSFSTDGITLPGLGTVQEEDVVYYDNGVWSVYFDGTALGLTTAGQDLDATNVVSGVLYFSTLGTGNTNPVPGVPGPYDDADIYSWNGTSFSRLFDASTVGVPANANVDGVVVEDATHLYLSFAGDVVLPGLGTIQDEDVVYYDNGAWSVYFDGTAQGLVNAPQDLDAFDLGAILVPPAAPGNLVVMLNPTAQANLGWTDNASNELGFRIERCTGTGCTEFAPIAEVGADVIQYNDATVVPDTLYSYRVLAFNADGNSLASNPMSLYTTPQAPGLYFSTLGGGNTNLIPDVAGPYDDSDLYAWNGEMFGRLFDASVAGVADNTNVDGMVIEDAAHFYLSFATDTVLPGLGLVQDEDVVYYSNGVWSVFFDGTALGLTNTGHDLDAISLANGVLYFSTVGTGATTPIPGVPGPYDDADIYSWDGTSFGRLFDASVAGLLTNANVDGLVVVDATHFYLSFAVDTGLPGLGNVQDEDVVYYNAGVWSVYFDGTALGLVNAGQDIDAFDLP
jgi:hypothetical protein